MRDLDGGDEGGQSTLYLSGRHSSGGVDAGDDSCVEMEKGRLQVKHLYCQLKPAQRLERSHTQWKTGLPKVYYYTQRVAECKRLYYTSRKKSTKLQ